MSSMASPESGLDAWLRYAPLPAELRKGYKPHSEIIALSESDNSPVFTAGKELQTGIQRILGQEIPVSSKRNNTASSIVIGTLASYTSAGGKIHDLPEMKDDGFWLSTQGDSVQILGQNERGALYGTFEYLSMLAQGDFSEVAYASNPSAPIRWANEWDNLDGSIERGYGGKSFFFRDGKVLEDLRRAGLYARLLASVGINGIVVVRTCPRL
jgi:alpha-glucuronidase